VSIKSIKIKNLLSFDELIINDFKNINCIVGRNNSGKSNLLKLIRFFYHKLEDKRELPPTLNSKYSTFGTITIIYDTSRIKQNFKKFLKNILKNNTIPLVKKENINEFRIGKSYFYELRDNNDLLSIPKNINIAFQRNIPLNNAVVSFRKNKSYLDLFEPHSKNYYFLRLDIKAFFHSIEARDIKDIFSSYFEDNHMDDDKKQTLINAFINIVTYIVPNDSPNEDFRGKKILPMGFVTSPVVSNIVFRKIDIQIQKFCAQHNIVYTRYADDMLFSSTKNSRYIHSDGFINEISILVSQMKFKLNQHKTLKSTHTLSLNGYTIQYSNIRKDILGGRDEKIINEFRLSNKKINIIKKMIHFIETEKQTPRYILQKLFNYQLSPDVPIEKQEEYYKHQLSNKLTGYRSYLLSFVIFDKKYGCMQKVTIKKYIELIEKLNENIL